MTKTTVHDLLVSKGRRKWVQVHVDSAAEAAGLSAGMPHGVVSNRDGAIDCGFAVQWGN